MEPDGVILLAKAFAVGVVAGLLPIFAVIGIFILACIYIFGTNGLEGWLYIYLGVFLLPGYVPGYIVGRLAKAGWRKRKVNP